MRPRGSPRGITQTESMQLLRLSSFNEAAGKSPRNQQADHMN